MTTYSSKRLFVTFDNDEHPTVVRISGKKHTLTYRLSPWGITAAIELIDAYIDSTWKLATAEDKANYRQLKQWRKNGVTP